MADQPPSDPNPLPPAYDTAAGLVYSVLRHHLEEDSQVVQAHQRIVNRLADLEARLERIATLSHYKFPSLGKPRLTLAEIHHLATEKGEKDGN